jgi:hypothetical protein
VSVARRKLGELLVRAGILEPKDVTAALREQLRWGGPLGRILIDMKLVTEDVLVQALSAQLGIGAVALDDWSIAPALLDLIPVEVAERHNVIPFNTIGGVLEVAMSDPTSQGVLDELRIRAHMDIRPYVAGPTALERAMAKYYHRGPHTQEPMHKRPRPMVRRTTEDHWGDEAPDMLLSEDATEVQSKELELPSATAAYLRDILSRIASLQQEMQAVQRRVATLESLINRDEDVLRKLMSLLIEKRVASREEILDRIK